MTFDMDEFQQEVADWHILHFPRVSEMDVLAKLTEEVGELARARLRLRWGECADTDECMRQEEMDAIGDIMIVLAAYVKRAGIPLTLAECAELAWDNVGARDHRRIVDGAAR